MRVLTTRLNWEIVHFCQESTVDREGLQSRLGVKMAVKGATPYELGHGKSYKGLLAEYGEPVHAYTKSLNKGEGQDTYVLTDGVQVALSKCIREQNKIGPNIWRSTNFGGRVIATKRRAEALPAAQTDIPREHVMLKFKDEDAEAVMAKALEGESDSEKEEHFQNQCRFQPRRSSEKRWK